MSSLTELMEASSMSGLWPPALVFQDSSSWLKSSDTRVWKLRRRRERCCFKLSYFCNQQSSVVNALLILWAEVLWRSVGQVCFSAGLCCCEKVFVGPCGNRTGRWTSKQTKRLLSGMTSKHLPADKIGIFSLWNLWDLMSVWICSGLVGLF